jgi:RNA polymerase sigma-70 factor (ECF subfamily)
MMTITETNNTGRIDDEAALVAAAQAGNATCFETLVRRYERRIFRLANSIAMNEGDAEEVTQEAFFRAFQHIEDFKGESRFYTWLVRITINEALMKLRKRRPGQVSLDDPIATEGGYVPREIEDWEPTPEERYSQNELANILSGAISELHPRLRVVLQLRDVESLSTQETASLLRISASAVKARLLRARLALRGKLNPFLRRDAQFLTTTLCAFAARDMRQVASERVGAP